MNEGEKQRSWVKQGWNELMRKRSRIKLLMEINSAKSSTGNLDAEDILNIGDFEHIYLFLVLNMTLASLFVARDFQKSFNKLAFVIVTFSYSSITLLVFSESIAIQQALRKEKNYASLYARLYFLREESEKANHAELRKTNENVIKKYFAP